MAAAESFYFIIFFCNYRNNELLYSSLQYNKATMRHCNGGLREASETVDSNLEHLTTYNFSLNSFVGPLLQKKKKN